MDHDWPLVRNDTPQRATTEPFDVMSSQSLCRNDRHEKRCTLPASLSVTVRRGSAVFGISAVGSRISGLIGHCVLGSYLSDEDFGLFGIAIGTLSVTFALRNAGVQPVLQALPDDEFYRDGGGLLRLSTIATGFGLLMTVLAAGIAPCFGGSYKLSWMLVLSAVAATMPALAMPSRSRLQANLRFVPLAAIDTSSAFLRSGLAIALAVGGGGSAALIVPLLVSGAAEAMATACLAPVPVISMLWRASNTHGAMRTVRWTAVSAIATTLVTQGDYLGASCVVSAQVVGQYFFAYSLCNQMNLLLSTVLTNITIPIVAALRYDANRQTRAAEQVARTLGIVVPGLMICLPTAFREIDLLIWGGRWQHLQATLLPLASSMAAMLTTTLLYCILQATGSFRLPALLELGRGTLVVIGAIVGSYFLPTSRGIALGVGICAGLPSVAFSVAVAGRVGLSISSAIRAFGGPLCIGLLASIGNRFLFDQCLGWSGAAAAYDPRWAIEAAAVGILTGLTYAVLCFLFLPTTSRSVVTFLTCRFGRKSNAALP